MPGQKVIKQSLREHQSIYIFTLYALPAGVLLPLLLRAQSILKDGISSPQGTKRWGGVSGLNPSEKFLQHFAET